MKASLKTNVAPVIKTDWNRAKAEVKKPEDMGFINPAEDPRMLEIEQQKQITLKQAAQTDTLNAVMDNGQRWDEAYDEWADLSEEERIEYITDFYDDIMAELWQEIEDDFELKKSTAKQKYEDSINEQVKINMVEEARDAAEEYAKSLGYTVIDHDSNKYGTSCYLIIDNGKLDEDGDSEGPFALRFSDHAQPLSNYNGEDITFMRNGKIYSADYTIEAVIDRNYEIVLSNIWQFLEDNAPTQEKQV